MHVNLFQWPSIPSDNVDSIEASVAYEKHGKLDFVTIAQNRKLGFPIPGNQIVQLWKRQKKKQIENTLILSAIIALPDKPREGTKTKSNTFTTSNAGSSRLSTTK